MRVLLTGGTGFLGSHIAQALVEAGHDVVALVRPQSLASAGAQLPTAQLAAGDVLDPGSLRDACAGCEAVVHTAAMVAFSPTATAQQREINVEGTRHVL